MTRSRVRSTTAAAAIAIAIAAAPEAARAQVNVEGVREKIKNKPFHVAIDGSVTGRLGNVSGIVGSASLLAAAKRGPNMGFLQAQGDIAKFGAVTSVAKSFAHLRYNYQFLPWLNGELFTQVQQDRFQRLALRQVDGIGPRFALVRREGVHVYYGTSYMFEYERLLSDVEGELAPFPAVEILASRWNNYLSVVLAIGGTVDITSVLYFQPRFDVPQDFRVLSESAASVTIVKHVAAKLTVKVRHDSLPPSGVKTTDFETTNSLSLSY